MGAVGGLLGLGGGAGGSGFSPTNGTSAQQLGTAYTGAQNAMEGQTNLLRAIQGQNGLQNQSNVYNQFQNVASGQGPNPAQAMLNQATGANVANQAALMGGQRGAGANVGLMARQAGQQGAGLQQQAAGQGASMQAQQSLGALGQAGQMANTMAGNQIGQTNALSQAQQNEQGILQGANTAHQNIQGQLANTTMQGQQALIGGLMNSFGGAGKAAAGAPAAGAKGGEVQRYADGGGAGPQSMFAQMVSGNVAQGSMPQFSQSNAGADELRKGAGSFGGGKPPSSPMAGAKNITPSGYAGADMGAGSIGRIGTMVGAHGGKVPALLSPGEKFLRPNEVKMVAGGKVSPDQVGENIPGKAPVKGNSYKNDIVKKDLEPGGIVIPRSVMNSKDPAKGAAEFVRSVLAKKGKRA
jgi:hypothetical protein